MMTSGLVVTLDSHRPDAVAAIRSQPHITIGEHNGRLLSLAIEAGSPFETEQVHDWLAGLPGVENVEVVFVHRDDAEDVHVSH